MISTIEKQIFIENKHLPVNCGTYKTKCPSCGEDGSFSVTNNGVGFLYNCFRNSCNIKGFIPLNPSELVKAPTQHSKKTEDYIIEIENLSEPHLQFFNSRFGLDRRTLEYWGVMWAPIEERVCFQVMDEYGRIIGRSYRFYSELSDKPLPKRKTMHFIYDTNVPFAYYSPWCLQEIADTIILCEDPVSAIKLTELGESMGFKAIGLLGTNLSSDVVLSLKKRDVVLWLDKDAQGKSVKYKNDYGIFFKSCKIISSTQDPKDCSENEILEKLLM